MTEIVSEAPVEVSGLRKNYVSFVENIAQSIGAVAPTAGIAALIPLVYATAGNGTWLMFVLVLIAYLFVASCIYQFATRIASAGALYTYMEESIGPFWGLLGGWCYLVTMLFAVGGLLMVSAHYAMPFVHLVTTQYDMPITYGLIFLSAFGFWFVTCRDVRLSTEVMLKLEMLSIGLLLVLAVAYLIKSPHGIDMDQVHLTGISWKGMQLALVLAFFSTTGFESSATLGSEAKDPLKSIPRSLFFGLVPIAILYIFFSYVMIDCFRDNNITLDKSDAPFNVMATASGMDFFGWIVSGCILISFFSCGVGCLNAGARIVYAMAGRSEFYRKAANVHPTHATPANAASFVIIIALLMAVGLTLMGVDTMDGYGYVGQISSFGFITSYFLISIAAPIFLRKRGELKARHVAISVAAVLLLLVPMIGSIYPVPPAPMNYLPYIFLAVLVIGVAYSKIVSRGQKPEISTTPLS